VINEVANEVAVQLDPVTSKKRKIAAPTSPKKKKVLFKDWELHLSEKYPIPRDLSLPQIYVDKHKTEFIKGLQYVLSKDPSLYPMIINAPFTQFDASVEPRSTSKEHFEGLCRTIIGQQVSGAAAKSIENKFKAHFSGDYPTPEQVLLTDSIELKDKCGLSARKGEYIKSIAQKFADKEVDDQFFLNATDDEIIQKLVEMKGIGVWSAKMTMVFGLHRLDVFAHDDLGVARGVSRYLETRPQLLKNAKLAVDLSLHKKRSTFDDKKKRDWKVIHDAHVNHIADNFKPYRSVFMLLMWRASATDIDILSK
jgi:DNA-3-methyladenine glycosylase II